MPKVNGKHFAYTPAGRKAAAAARKKAALQSMKQKAGRKK